MVRGVGSVPAPRFYGGWAMLIAIACVLWLLTLLVWGCVIGAQFSDDPLQGGILLAFGGPLAIGLTVVAGLFTWWAL